MSVVHPAPTRVPRLWVLRIFSSILEKTFHPHRCVDWLTRIIGFFYYWDWSWRHHGFHVGKLFLEGLKHLLRNLKLNSTWVVFHGKGILLQKLDKHLVLKLIRTLAHLDHHELLFFIVFNFLKVAPTPFFWNAKIAKFGIKLNFPVAISTFPHF
jgi:hypothetical protein